MKREVNALIMATLTLACLGSVMMFSIGGTSSDHDHLLLKHLVFMLVGLIGCVIAMKIDYHILGAPKVRFTFFALTVLLLIMTFIPGIGLKMGGASRWIGWRQLSFQPAELARFTLVLMLAVRLTEYQESIHKWWIGVIMPGLFFGIFGGIVFFQKDVGIPFMMALATLTIIWIAGVRLKQLLLCSLLLTPLIPFLVTAEGYRMVRLKSFINPWASSQGHGYQLIQSFSAFSQGGLSGKGMGYGEQKLGFLPSGHTDFIFASIAEELGFMGTIAVILLFTVLLIAGMRVVVRCPDLFGSLLAAGITALIVLQSFFVMLVNLGGLPTKGLPLPFVSYGGSALLVNLCMMGVLINIASQGKPEVLPVKATIANSRISKLLYWIFLPKPLKTKRA